jgi:hypothetical protein
MEFADSEFENKKMLTLHNEQKLLKITDLINKYIKSMRGKI